LPFDELRATLGDVAAVKIRVALALLADEGMIARVPGGAVRAREARRAPGLYDRLARGYAEKSEIDREKLERMVFYAQTGYCRWKVLVEYFGELMPGEACGHCDNCLKQARREAAPAQDAVVLRHPRKMRRRVYAAGDPVRVPRYGEGRVQRSAGDEVTVEFADGAVRTFLASYVRRARREAVQFSAAAD